MFETQRRARGFRGLAGTRAFAWGGLVEEFIVARFPRSRRVRVQDAVERRSGRGDGFGFARDRGFGRGGQGRCRREQEPHGHGSEGEEDEQTRLHSRRGVHNRCGGLCAV